MPIFTSVSTDILKLHDEIEHISKADEYNKKQTESFYENVSQILRTYEPIQENFLQALSGLLEKQNIVSLNKPEMDHMKIIEIGTVLKTSVGESILDLLVKFENDMRSLQPTLLQQTTTFEKFTKDLEKQAEHFYLNTLLPYITAKRDCQKSLSELGLEIETTLNEQVRNIDSITLKSNQHKDRIDELHAHFINGVDAILKLAETYKQQNSIIEAQITS